MPKVMIVDDSNFMRSKLRATLEKAGYEVVAEASNGAEAVDLYAKHQPDVVTMDIVMPEQNGLFAIQKIVEFDNNARIVVITALGHEPMIRKALSYGALNFIIKPVEPEEVLEILDGIMSEA